MHRLVYENVKLLHAAVVTLHKLLIAFTRNLGIALFTFLLWVRHITVNNFSTQLLLYYTNFLFYQYIVTCLPGNATVISGFRIV
jgi:hypothetical protein